jgi:hypothetical protein
MQPAETILIVTFPLPLVGRTPKSASCPISGISSTLNETRGRFVGELG